VASYLDDVLGLEWSLPDKTTSFLQNKPAAMHPDLPGHLAAELGGRLSISADGDYQITDCPAPGHRAGDNSLSVKLLKPENDPLDIHRGFLVKTFSPADEPRWRELRDYVNEAVIQALQAIADGKPPKIVASYSADRRELRTVEGITAEWDGLQSAKGTLAEAYLTNRKLVLPDDVAERVVRFEPRARWNKPYSHADRRTRPARDPAMVTALRDWHTNEIKCLQRTFLLPDRHERRYAFNTSPKGVAIKIDLIAPSTRRLHVAEGFETALAARQIGLFPVWAIGSAGGIKFFDVIAGIEELIILGENDNGASADAAKRCIARWEAAGKVATVIRPKDERFNDFNDMIMGRAK
jgi:putative DNA primase/helicase